MANGSPPVIGIAGGIGSGKSTVARILAQLGCLVVNSDDAGRAALRDPVISAELAQWWGEGVFDERGEIDRTAVARIVFADAVQRHRLEALVHPWIEERRREQFAAAGPDVPALVIDAPLLFEAGLDAECDAVIFVESGIDTRLQRVQASRGWDESELKKREDSQMRLDAKRSRADYAVTNDGDLRQLEAQVRNVFRNITGSSEGTRDSGCADTTGG